MPTVTRKIGLSLGADICWPIAFEEILANSRLQIGIDKETIGFASQRMPLRPFSLQDPSDYDMVVDRLTHWFPLRREWIKKAILMDDLYVLNNPWSVQSYQKHSSYCAMMALGMPIPATAMLPQKEYEPSDDLDYVLQRYAHLFELDSVGDQIGYPQFIKPYDGGGWKGVSRVDDAEQLRSAYDGSDRQLMHLQKAVDGFDLFVRAVGIGPQVRLMKYDPDQPLHQRYTTESGFCTEEERQLVEDTCLTINSFFGWDFNSCEALRRDGMFWPIDFANPCPDSQVNSIHYHWPWYMLSNLQWAVFVTATRKKMRKTVDFEPFYAIAGKDMPYRDKLSAYAAIARERFEADRFQEFCDQHLQPLREASFAWLAGDRCMEAIREKVQHVFPEHDVDEFSDLFLGLVRRGAEDLRQELGV